MSAVQQPRNRMTLWSRVARADRQAGEEQRNARAGVLLSKLVKGSGTKPGRDLMPLFTGRFIASEEPKAMMLRTGEMEHLPLRPAVTRESSDWSLSYRAYAITATPDWPCAPRTQPAYTLRKNPKLKFQTQKSQPKNQK